MDRPRYPTQLKIEQSMTEVEVEEATKMDLPLLLQRSSKGLDDSILQSFRQRWPPPSTAAFASGMNGCCPFKVQLYTLASSVV